MNNTLTELFLFPYFIDLIFDDGEIEVETGEVLAHNEFEAYRIVEEIAKRLEVLNNANDHYIWEITNEDKIEN